MTSARSIVVAGAQRSASTSLAEHLGRHPSIAMARRELLGLEDPYYPAALHSVLHHVRDAERQGYVPGLKRPELLHRPEGADRVARHLPGALVVISLREPVARAVSAYRHYVRSGLLPDLDIEAGLTRILDRRERPYPWEPGDQILKYSCYAEGVARFLQSSCLEVVVLFQEELVADSAAFAADILRRLGLEPVDLGPFARLNAGPAPDRVGLERLGNRIGYNVRNDLQTFVVTSNRLRRGAAKVLRMIAGAIPERQSHVDELSDEVRLRLADCFTDDALQLWRLLDRPLPPSWRASLAV